MNVSIFEPFIDEAIQMGQQLSAQKDNNDVWNNPKIVNYYSILPDDEITKYIADDIRDDIQSILIIGGAVGRLGRHIAKIHPSIQVTELDSSHLMVNAANQMAYKEGLTNRFQSVLGSAFSIPFDKCSFDSVISQGFIRYFTPEEQVKIIYEMERVAKREVRVGEGKGDVIITELAHNLKIREKAIKTPLKMFRMTLFYLLFKKFESDAKFATLIKKEAEANRTNVISILTEIAGEDDGIFYEIRILK